MWRKEIILGMPYMCSSFAQAFWPSGGPVEEEEKEDANACVRKTRALLSRHRNPGSRGGGGGKSPHIRLTVL